MTQQFARTWRLALAVVMFAALGARPAAGQAPDSLTLDAPAVVLRGVPFEVTAASETPLDSAGLYEVRVQSRAGGGEARTEMFTAEVGPKGRSLAADVDPSGKATEVQIVRDGAVLAETPVRAVPGWWSVLPPILAIAIALLFRRVVPALFLGVWVGAVLAVGLTLTGLAGGLFATLDTYVLGAIVDEGHAAIIIFSLMIGGMVGIISKNGGTQGLVDQIAKLASSPRRGQTAAGLLGLAIFFDDYANTLIVGNTLRPVTDRLRISREKLAYIVDSTAAPVASLALVTTWIGFEVGLINEAISGISTLHMSGYALFLESILYRFYPILALVFVFAIAFTDREFGPMLTAERRARRTGKVLGDDANVDQAAAEGGELAMQEGAPARWVNAVVPVLVLVVGVLVGLYLTGLPVVRDLVAQGKMEAVTIQHIIGKADSYAALMGASLAGVLVAAALSLGQRILSMEETVEAWYAGLKAMLFAMIVLVLAWALSEVTTVLHTGEYLAQVLGAWLIPGFLPALVFVLAAATAFATGSSWGAMGILMPLIVPLAWQVLQQNGIADPSHYHILYSAVSCVLAGAVWGDHCSPISDTTILSSMASGCDHIEHVRTQMPYALAVGAVALVLGTLPVGFGLPWWGALLVGAAALLGVLFTLGTPLDVDRQEAVSESSEGGVTERSAAPAS